ncbi:MAG: chloride channel protein [Clostridiales bacterium]|nr:chloride channel protein [Clostridiales bacterium]
MFKKQFHSFFAYLWAFFRWMLTGMLIGVLLGVVGAVFAICVEKATHLRTHHDFLVWLLPVGGLLIALMYRLMKLPLSIGTDEIIKTVRTQGHVPLLMAPAIFLSTTLTHLLGGSAGREGAALQLGGSIGAWVGDLTHPKSDSRRIFELCGMAALFSALFGTPVTAAVFVLEIIEVGRINSRAFLPCFASSVTASLIAKLVGAPEEPWNLASGLQSIGAVSYLEAAVVGIACAAMAIVFCVAMHMGGKYFKKLIKNDYVRIFVGGAVVVALSMLLKTRDYNGGGMQVIFDALNGKADAWAFLLKLLFTMITLCSGFKGGEIVPSFFIGATMGCTVAGLIGMSPALGAALGLIGMFSGVTNAPIAAIIMSVELFGAEYLPLFGIVAAVAFMLSGHFSLYHAQMFTEPQLGHEEN